MTDIFILLGLIAICVGLLGTVYPAIPGLGLMFGGAWLLAYAGDYQIYGTNTLFFSPLSPLSARRWIMSQAH